MIYSMSNFIVRVHRSGLKVTSHKYKLGVFLKTNFSILFDNVFPFCPLRFTPFREIDEMCASNNIFLIVVGKEAPEDIITQAGQSSKRLRLYLEDVEKNKMKCTLFGEFVGEALSHLERTDVQPLVLVVQLFKPRVWLEDVNVQTSFYGSRVLFNPTFPDAVEFRNRLINLGKHATQQISHVESQGQRSLTQELSSGEFSVLSIEEVYNLTEFLKKPSITTAEPTSYLHHYSHLKLLIIFPSSSTSSSSSSSSLKARYRKAITIILILIVDAVPFISFGDGILTLLSTWGTRLRRASLGRVAGRFGLGP
ncbi:hypothetical protein PIB30_062510 [Stylosanthes scabra]|uniref:Uncharacterized protein n=1 Tax=Stylosanthes scabra TaxID=79078 RepID=A0ABU6XM43_9FABA|nr:hypothetical protein [Stylosanthes scabra]